MNEESKYDLVERIVTLLDETLIDESGESQTKPLIESKARSKARRSLNRLAEMFWFDVIDECEKYNIDVEKEWIRIRSNLSRKYKRGLGYNRTN